MLSYRVFLLTAIFTFLTMAQEPQEGFTVAALEGTANVQHYEHYDWAPLSNGDNISNDDIIETDFQTKIRLQFAENVVVLGSNSKALINLNVNNSGDSDYVEIKLTLFNGGMLTKTQRNCRLSVFTSSAIAKADTAIFSTVTDGKSGESGFQVIYGNVNIRNVALTTGMTLQTGFTTVVQPNREPGAAMLMTNRHVSVLKHYFGDEFIQIELDKSGVRPSDEKTNTRLSFSGNYSSGRNAPGNDDMYKALFSLERIYGSIVDDEMNEGGYNPPSMPFRSGLEKKRFCASIGTEQGKGNDQHFSSYIMSFAFKTRLLSAGLRFAIAEKEQSGKPKLDFSSTEAILDKVDFITLGSLSDSLYAEIGPINDLTFGNGLVIDGFRNSHPGVIYRTAGLHAQAKYKNYVGVNAFINNVADPQVGGVYLGFEPSSYYIGLGYAFDLDQQKNLIDRNNFRYSPSVYHDSIPEGDDCADVHVFEASLGSDLAFNYQLKSRIFVEYAQKINFENGKNKFDGALLRAPYFYTELMRNYFAFSMYLESGRLTGSQFSRFYMQHRNFIYTDSLSGRKTIESVNSVLSRKRRAIGFSIEYGTNPVKGLDLSVKLSQNLKERNTFTIKTDSADTAVDGRLNYSLYLSCSINDSLLKFIRYAGIYACGANGTYYPRERNPLVAWQSEAGIDILSNPIVFNVALESRLRYFYCENSKTVDNHINSTEHVIEWYIGLIWSFL